MVVLDTVTAVEHFLDVFVGVYVLVIFLYVLASWIQLPYSLRPVQRFLYAASVLHCLPVGRSEEGSAATGTVLRTARLDEYAAAAGFSAVEVLPVDHAMFRLYRLR